MDVLIAVATGCAVGLFFGWLLHRQRVERTIYEDVLLHRDRATSALAETAARLELANKDLVVLRARVTDLEDKVDARDQAIADLERAASDDARAGTAPGDTDPFEDRSTADASGDAAVTDVHGDDLALDEEATTQEVLIAAADADPPDADPPAPEAEAALADGPDADAADAGPPPAQVALADAPDTDAADAGPPPAQMGLADAPDTDECEDADPPEASAALADERQDADPSELSAGWAPTAQPADTMSSEQSVDDLQRIDGVGPALERQLRDRGIDTYRKLALLDDRALADLKADAPRVATALRRKDWIAQARRLHIEWYGTVP